MQDGWFIYDAVSLEAPAGAEVAPVAGLTVLQSARVSPALVERQGRSFQKIAANVIRAGGPSEASFRLDGREVERVRLQPGRQTVELLVPAEDKVRPALLDVVVDGAVCGEEKVILTPGVREIILVFKTHFDIGFTDLVANVVKKYRTKMIDAALDVIAENRDQVPGQQFVWTIPGWPMHKMLEDWSGQTAERQQRLRTALKEGHIALLALPFNTHTESLELEDLVHGLRFSSQISRDMGLELPRDAKMTDVPEHIRTLPTLLAHAGVQFMEIGCNTISGPAELPSLFWWQGPDGSRVLTMYSPDYGTQLTPDPGWPYHTWLALLVTSDNSGPPTPETVKRLLARAARDFPGVKVRIGRLSDFSDAIRTEKLDLPVVSADTPDTWIHGLMSDPDGAKIARHARPLIAVAESLNTELRAWGAPLPDAAPAIGAAYEQSLLYGEHTWGLGAHAYEYGAEFQRRLAAGDYKRAEQSWADHTAYIERARDLVAPVLGKNLAALAESVDVAGPRVVVFNPLPWRRDGVVSVKWPGPAPVALASSEGGAAVPVECGDGEIRFFARDLPPTGYRTFVPAVQTASAPAVRIDEKSDALESPFFKAVLDPERGVVRSLIDKRTGREFVDASAEVGFGQFLYERFDLGQMEAYCRSYLKPTWSPFKDFFKQGIPPDAEGYRAVSPRNFQLSLGQTPLAAVATMTSAPEAARVAWSVTTRLILPRNEPYAELEITLHGKPPDPWPEAGWLCLPLKVDRPQFRLGRLGTLVDPAREIVPGTNRNFSVLNTGLTIEDPAGRGFGVCPLDQPLVSLDTPGCWKSSRDFVPRKPVAYFNLFNNQWNTNFRLWNSGTWTYRVRLWSVENPAAEAALITPSFETRYPLQAAAADGPAGRLSASRKGLQLSRKGILVTAFGANPDGAGLVLRLWEYAGQGGSCAVTLPSGLNVASVQPVDLRGGDLGSPIPVRGGVFTMDLPAFAPLTVKIASLH